MKKKIIFSILLCLLLVITVGCASKARQSAIDFKNEYEAINGKTLKGDIKYRDLTISDKNPYVKTTIADIAQKIQNKETFYLYVGDPLCPWCRSGLEKMIEVANKEKVTDIYYIDFWDDEHNEILRDLYEVQTVNKKDVVVKTKDAAEGYDVLIEAVKDFAQDYTLTKDGKTYEVGVKRTFGGDHFYFVNGECKKYVSLRSDKLAKATDELTEEVLKDQETNFTKFFEQLEVCTEESNC